MILVLHQKYRWQQSNVNILRYPPPTSISTVIVRPHYSKWSPLMLSCAVYSHICSDSLHLISGVDHPWNMDRQLQRMIQNCIQFIVCFAQYVISLHYCYQVITANIIHIQRFWSSYGWSVIESESNTVYALICLFTFLFYSTDNNSHPCQDLI